MQFPFITSFLNYKKSLADDLCKSLEEIADFVEPHENKEGKISYISGMLYSPKAMNSFFRLENWINDLDFSKEFSIVVCWEIDQKNKFDYQYKNYTKELERYLFRE